MVERYEDELIEWYWNHQAKNLTHWLCMERVLDPGEKGKGFFILWLTIGPCLTYFYYKYRENFMQ